MGRCERYPQRRLHKIEWTREPLAVDDLKQRCLEGSVVAVGAFALSLVSFRYGRVVYCRSLMAAAPVCLALVFKSEREMRPRCFALCHVLLHVKSNGEKSHHPDCRGASFGEPVGSYLGSS